MNEAAYRAVRGGRRAAFAQIDRGYIEAVGRDRLSYLQGQISNDVAALPAGQGCRACLLNNTGHLLAELRVYELGDHALIETDRELVQAVVAMLERFVVRERVVFRDVSSGMATVTVQGEGAAEMLAPAGLMPVAERKYPTPLSTQRVVARGDEARLSIARDRTGAGGYDVVSPVGTVSDIVEMMLYSEFAAPLDPDTLDILRIEAGIPVWGNELDESVIPLEAEMHDAISYTKGCYVGQEIIARIHSRGHVNKALRMMRFTSPVNGRADIDGLGGTRDGVRIGRITSAGVSPALGPVALGYVHSEYGEPGSAVACSSIAGTVLPWPPTAGFVV